MPKPRYNDQPKRLSPAQVDDFLRDYILILESRGLDKDQQDMGFAILAEEGVSRIEWTTYWHEGRAHLGDDVHYFDASGNILKDVFQQIDELLYDLLDTDIDIFLIVLTAQAPTSFGRFRLDVPGRRLCRIGDARFQVLRKPIPEDQQRGIDL